MHKEFLSLGDVPAIAGLREGRRPQLKHPRQIQIYSTKKLRSSPAIRVKIISTGEPEVGLDELSNKDAETAVTAAKYPVVAGSAQCPTA